MSRKNKLGRGIPLHRQSKELIFNVYEYLREQHKYNNNVKPPLEQTAQATKLSLATIKNVVREKNKSSPECSSPFSSPKKKWKCLKKKINIDGFDNIVIRQCIHDFHIKKKELPTLSKLLVKLKSDINFKGGRTSLWHIVKELGFKWRKTEDNKKILIEKSDIVFKRITFLENITKFRDEGRPIVYMGETYIDTTHTSAMSWSNSSNEGLKKPITKGSRFNVVHAGGEAGFIPNALLVYKAHQKSGDYHNDMNNSNYEKWLKEKLIPNLHPSSVLVIDNAPYHNNVLNPVPNSNSKKQVMIDWLRNNNISFTPNLLKPQLYKRILWNKPRHKDFKMDAILEEHGHTALRLPPCHPELNPIENMWSLIMGYVGSKNVPLTMDSVHALVEERVSQITTHEWVQVCQHAQKEEKKYKLSDAIIDYIMDENNFIINAGDSSSQSESEESEISSEESDE